VNHPISSHPEIVHHRVILAVEC